MKKYEALFILSNTISDEQLETKIEQISSEIVKFGGTVQAATRMGRITFARPLAKKEAGIYTQIVFLMEPAKINSLHERYRHNEDLIRLQITAAKPPACNATQPAVATHQRCGRAPNIEGRPAEEQVSAATRLRPETHRARDYGGQVKKDNSAFVPGAKSPGTRAKQVTT